MSPAVAGLLLSGYIHFKPYPSIPAQHFVDLQEQPADRPDLVVGVHPVDLFDIAEAAGILRHDPGQGGIHTPGRDHVRPGDALHPLEFVLEH